MAPAVEGRGSRCIRWRAHSRRPIPSGTPRAQWTVAADSPERSFTAELEGMVDWKSGATHLSGVVTSGWMKGAWVQQIGQSVNGDMSGILELAPGRREPRDGKPRS